MSIRFFFILFVILPVFSQAQNISRIDSLKSLLPVTEGEAKFNLLNELGFEYRLSYPDSTIKYCEQAYALGKELNLKKGMSKPLSFIGLASAYKGDYKTSFDYHNRAIAIAEEEEDSVQLAFGYNNFGRLFFDQGDLVRAYNNLIKAQELFTELGDKNGLSYVVRSLSNLYKSQHDFDKALQMSLYAYELRMEAGEPRAILSALMELGLVYEEVNDTTNAIRVLQQADSIAEAIHDEISDAEIGLALAEILLDQNLSKRGYDEARKSYAIIERAGNQRLMPRANLLLGRSALAMGNIDRAIQYLNAVIVDARKTNNLTLQRDANYYLGEIYEQKGNDVQAIEYKNRYLILKESLLNVDLARQIERLQFQLEIEKREKENERLMASNQQQRLQNITLYIVIFMVSLFAVVLWVLNRKRKEVSAKLAKQNNEIQQQRAEIVRQNDKLSRRNSDLFELNHEKDTIMSIVSHDLKSPLNRIKGLVEVLKLDQSQRDQYVEMIRESAQNGLDLIKDLLDVHMLEENVAMEPTTHKLESFLVGKAKLFKETADLKQIQLNVVNVEPDQTFTTDLDYLDRIIDNLLSNAIKFSRQGTAVEIGGGRNEQEFWITIKDHGPGFSESDKTQLFQKFRKLSARPTAGESSNGLGLAIVKTLVDRLEGSITLTSELGEGSEFRVAFPNEQEKSMS